MTSRSSASGQDDPNSGGLDTASQRPPVTQPPPFLFGSLSSVWRGLKAEVSGFCQTLTDSGASASSSDIPAGSKRARTDSVSSVFGGGSSKPESPRDGKRRKMDPRSDQFLPGDDAPPVPPVSQANVLSEAYELSSPGRPHDARPSRSALKQPAGLHSLSGKRKLGAIPPTFSTVPDFDNPAIFKPHVHFNLPNATAVPDHRTTLGLSGGVKDFTFPPPLTVPSDISMTSPSSKKGKGKEKVDTMLLGDLTFDVVNRAWKDAKEEERTQKDHRRIEELEKEVKRLKKELSTQAKAEHQPSQSTATSGIFRSPSK
ncbi:hypothetical protein P7C70_g675, partial [Phenoliferia sp. Uapishka_3]